VAREEGGIVKLMNSATVPPLCAIAPDDPPPTYGKKLHDPLAACCAIDLEIGTWRSVEMFRERGQWGSRLSPGSNTRIIIDYDHERFIDVLCGAAPPADT